MTTIVILNIVLAAFVVVGIVGILSWGIVRNEKHAASLSERAHRYARSRQRTPAPAAPRGARQYGYPA